MNPENNWLPIASALSSFWAKGEGPSESILREALGTAGIEYKDVKGPNKQETVANAVSTAAPPVKKKIVTELVNELQGGSYFQSGTPSYQAKKVEKLQSALQTMGCELHDDGYLQWKEPSGQKIQNTQQPGPSETPAASPLISGSYPSNSSWGPSLDTLLQVLRDLPEAAASLTRNRRSGKTNVDVWDEYDIQDFMEMALRLLYEDVRPEEYGGSVAGVSSRVDFLIKREMVLVEAKVAYKGHANKTLAEQLSIDLLHYAQRPHIKDLVCAVYDLDGSLKNPKGFKEDLESHKVGSLRVHVVAQAWPYSTRSKTESGTSEK